MDKVNKNRDKINFKVPSRMDRELKVKWKPKHIPILELSKITNFKGGE